MKVYVNSVRDQRGERLEALLIAVVCPFRQSGFWSCHAAGTGGFLLIDQWHIRPLLTVVVMIDDLRVMTSLHRVPTLAVAHTQHVTLSRDLEET